MHGVQKPTGYKYGGTIQFEYPPNGAENDLSAALVCSSRAIHQHCMDYKRGFLSKSGGRTLAICVLQYLQDISQHISVSNCTEVK